MQLYTTTRQESRVIVEPTLGGRLVAAAVRLVVWTPVAMVGLSILFLPDYLCQYREQQPVPGMFWMVIGAGAVFLAAIGAFVRFSRRDRWVFDAEADEIVFRAEPLVGPTTRTAAGLGEWTRLKARRAGMWDRSRIEIGLEEHPAEPICESRFGWGALQEIWEDLVAFVEQAGLDVEIEETPAGRG